MIRVHLAGPCLALLALAACGGAEPPRGTAIVNVTVIDAAHGERPGMTVVFDGDRILSVEPAEAEAPNVETTIDGTGRYLVPGLWDMHVHLTYDDAFTASMPAAFLYYGITSVRDTGGLLHELEPVITRMETPGAHAPRVYWSGPLLDGSMVVYDGKSRPEIGTQNAAEAQARANVAALAAAGADFIKIYELVSPAVFDALVSAAAEHELPIAAHVPLSMTAPMAGPEVDSMEHVRNVELACAGNAAELHEARLQRLANPGTESGYELRSALHAEQRLPAIAAYDRERCSNVLDALAGTIQVPTLRLNAFDVVPPYTRDGWDAALEFAPAARASGWAATASEASDDPMSGDTRFGDWSLKLVGDMHASGVPVGAGTDTPIGMALPGFSLHAELQMLVRAGLDPLAALEAATVMPARFFGLQDRMGNIATDLRADMLLLSANPLDDIANTQKIDTVISRGRVMPRTALAEKLRQAVTEPQ